MKKRKTLTEIDRCVMIVCILGMTVGAGAQHRDKPRSEASGKSLVVLFDAAGHGFTDDNFAAKLIGKNSQGKLLFGYARLPGVDYSPYRVERKTQEPPAP